MIATKISLAAVFLAALTAVLGGTTRVASAADCSTGRNLRGYQAGVLAGRSIVSQAWNGIGQDPDAVDEFKVIVENAVNTAISGLPGGADVYVQCRAKGLGQGVVDRLAEIQAQVVTACLLDGTTWGELSADLYCALSRAFDGLDVLGLLPNPPDGLCGTTFETACHTAFQCYASTPDNACVEYATGPAFEETQLNMCVYEQ